MPQVEMYIKGAAIQKGSTWAYILVSGAHHKSGVGSMRQPSPNIAGLQAIIQGLHALKEACDVMMITSSTYLLGGIALLKNGTSYDTGRIYWLQLADMLTRHTITVCYATVADTPFLKQAYDLAVEEMYRAFGVEKELLGGAVKNG